MKLEFEAPLGQRVHRYFWAVTTNRANLWWNRSLKCWEPYGTHKSHDYSTHMPCRTLRAFKRMLRKHPEMQGKCILVNKYRGYNVHSTKEETDNA